MVQVQVVVALRVPEAPNFLRTTDDKAFDVADVSDEGLTQIGQEWTEALLANARERRANPKRRSPPSDGA